ncbi:hypothetical protein B5181_40030, partial [Streptomyces sp. 4F]
GEDGATAVLSGLTGEEDLVCVPFLGDTGDGTESRDVPLATHTLTARALGLVQEWLAQERFADSRLVFVT